MELRLLLATAVGAALIAPVQADPRFRYYPAVPVMVAPAPAPVMVAPPVDRSLTFAIQNELGMAGYAPGPPDGLFGPRTSYAILAYQQHNGLPPDGMVSVPLLDHLRARRAGATASANQAPLPPVLAKPQPAPAATQAPSTTTAPPPQASNSNGEAPICREFQQPGKIDGKDITTTGTACLQKDGTWKPTN